jgi:hypothetical protein
MSRCAICRSFFALWGGWAQSRGNFNVTASRLKGGCSQEWPPYKTGDKIAGATDLRGC